MGSAERLCAAGAAILSLLVGAGCDQGEARLPVTQHSQSFQALNERLRGSAPPAAGEVTATRLENARSEPHNWLTYYGAYDGQRYSGLDQVTAGNVGGLRTAWQFQHSPIGLIAGPANFSFEATPIVVDGVMYLSGPDAHVWALEAASGEMLWHYHHAVPLDVPLCCGNVNRGVAVAEGKVFFATPNGRLIALDAATGQPVWEQAFADPRAGESATVAPLIVNDKVLVGSSGGEYGVRGHIDAFKIADGSRVWRRYTVPKPGEPGSETWAGDSWQRGGGPAWITGTYDPELDLVYWSTGNPGPVFEGSGRPGDNLFTNTILALDPETGAIRWHYQTTPHDVWDYDGVNENILIDRDGRRLLAHFDKNGYLFVLDRTDGQLLHATPFVTATWGRIDRRTGEVTARREPTAEGIEICPGPAGGKEWNHATYSRDTGLLYAPVIDLCATFRAFETEFHESMPYWGGDVRPERERQAGFVKAFDPLTGEEVWSWRTPHPVVASLLSTAGGVVFVGLATGEFVALDAANGEALWQFQTGSGIHGSAITYAVDGHQYVAVPSAWGGWVEGFAPELYGAPRGGALLVFALP